MAKILLIAMLVPSVFGANFVKMAQAGTDTGTLTVSVTVMSACSLSSGLLDFGTYTAGQVTDLTSQGTIGYSNCSGNLSFELDGGQSGNINGRQMQLGTNRINYQLYRNSARTNLFGAGVSARALAPTSIQSGTIIVYGRIPKGQLVEHGAYSDLVNITLSF